MSRQSAVGCSLGHRNLTFPPLFQLCASKLAIASLLTLAIPSRPAAALNPFDMCVSALRRTDIPAELAAQTCAETIDPKEFGQCVLRISVLTPTLANNALLACKQVRRPGELATCVVDINKRTQSQQANSVLEHCTRSLLPMKFSECVVALSRAVDFPIPRALSTCIDADNFETDLTPRFVPPPPPNPTVPPNVPELLPVPTEPMVPPGTPVNPVNL